MPTVEANAVSLSKQKTLGNGGELVAAADRTGGTLIRSRPKTFPIIFSDGFYPF
jgi:hypothetical protein